MMSPENFDYHFYYKGHGKFFQPLKSMIASDNVYNVAWNAPILIFGGMYLQSKVGGLKTHKIFAL